MPWDDETKREYQRDWYQRNKARLAEPRRQAQREWQRANKEKVNAWSRASYARRKGTVRAKQKAKLAALSPEQRRARYLKNRVKVPKSLFRAGAQTYRVKKKYPHLTNSLTTKELQAWFDAHVGQPCRYCGAPATEIDHITPLSRDGAHLLDNLQMLCSQCNKGKWDLTHKEFEAWILRLKV